eukprot:Pgem_evm2s175
MSNLSSGSNSSIGNSSIGNSSICSIRHKSKTQSIVSSKVIHDSKNKIGDLSCWID